MLQHIRKRWFLIGLLASLGCGYLLQQPLEPLASPTWLRSTIVTCLFFLMGLTFPTETLLSSVRRPVPALLAIGLNAIALPALMMSVAWMLPDALKGGLLVAAAVPCTLASASLWTRRCGGDDSVSMLVSVVTNFFCFLIAPATLLILVGQAIDIDFKEQAIKLALLVVLPMVLAQLLRRIDRVTFLVEHFKSEIAAASQFGILLMVLLGTVVTSNKMAGSNQGLGTLGVCLMVLLAAGVHLAIFYVGWRLAKIIRLERPQQMAVAIAGSQKTLMVGLQIAIDCGVSILPMIAYHICQLVLDTLIVDRWAEQSDSPNEPCT